MALADKEDFKLVGCMAHVRRKFYEAFEIHGEDSAEELRVLLNPDSGARASDWLESVD